MSTFSGEDQNIGAEEFFKEYEEPEAEAAILKDPRAVKIIERFKRDAEQRGIIGDAEDERELYKAFLRAIETAMVHFERVMARGKAGLDKESPNGARIARATGLAWGELFRRVFIGTDADILDIRIAEDAYEIEAGSAISAIIRKAFGNKKQVDAEIQKLSIHYLVEEKHGAGDQGTPT